MNSRHWASDPMQCPEAEGRPREIATQSKTGLTVEAGRKCIPITGVSGVGWVEIQTSGVCLLANQ